MAKRTGSGGGRKRGRARSAQGKSRAPRKGRNARSRAKGEAPRARRGPEPDAGREAVVRETHRPTIGGQRVVAEDRDGRHWRVECLGEPVEIGSRIVFLPVGSESAGRGEMVRLVEAPRTQWVCTLHRGRGRLRLTPFGGLEAPELELADVDSKDAPDGTRVVVAPVAESRPGRRRSTRAGRGPARPRGLRVRVVEVLGRPFEPDSDHRALVWKHRLETATSRRARLEVEEIDAGIPRSELDRRVDLRHLPFVTIDPASARDHDDAVFAEAANPAPVSLVEDGGGRAPAPSSGRLPSWAWRLWVAIADVAHFVPRGGWVDAEARRRGNSFYFPDRAIPMLPERLSSDLCSLRPEVDRLAVVVELRVDRGGRVADALFHEAVIRSRARLSYEEAAQKLAERRPRTKPGVDPSSTPDWAESLRCLDAVTERIAKVRFRAGAIALELPELEVVVDDAGRPQDVRLRTRNRAHTLIEEAMLAANRAVARALDTADRETIHRVHPPPSPTKLAALTSLFDRLGIGEGADLSDPDALPAILREVQGTRLEERVNDAVLRSMSQARYSAEMRGHFALRFDHYTHFTSPIRRYADLEVHRALKRLLQGGPTDGESGLAGEGAAQRLAIWLSGRERVAAEVEREAQALACCAIMHGREGERFEAKVMAPTEFGLFVRLDAPAVSGLVPMRVLGDDWRHDPDEEVLIATRSGRRVALGDRVEVELLEVDPDRIRIAFGLIRVHRGERPSDRGVPS